MKTELLYNVVLLKSRNFNFYLSYKIKDNINNKIILLLIYFSFIFNKLKKKNFKDNQKLFDFIFRKIETDIREIGYGDMSVNKKMKIIINKFYSILLNFNNFLLLNIEIKKKIIKNLLIFEANNLKYLINIINILDKFAKKIDLISTNDIYNANF